MNPQVLNEHKNQLKDCDNYSNNYNEDTIFCLIVNENCSVNKLFTK